MRNKISVASQPRKVRKAQINAPLHIKHKMLGAHLSKDLRAQYGKRAVVVRAGDKVEVMRGKFGGTVGKVDEVSTAKSAVTLENVTISRTDGTKIKPKIHASNLRIVELNMEDSWRNKALERKK